MRFKHCYLKRPSPREIRKCLEGTHLLFMGDSITRYLYLSIAHVVSRGHWPARFSHKDLPNYPKSIITEKDFGSWEKFYDVSNSILSGKAVDPEYGKYSEIKPPASVVEICNCHRNERDEVKEGSWLEGAMENRHLRYNPSGIPTDTNDVRLSYIQWMGHDPTRGHKYFPELVNAARKPAFASTVEAQVNSLCPGSSLIPITKSCIHEIMAKTRDYDGRGIPTFMQRNNNFGEQVLRPMGVTHGIFNIGHHDDFHDDWREYMLRKLVDMGTINFVPPESAHEKQLNLTRVVWRSVNAYSYASEDVHLKNLSVVYPNRISFFDIFNMTKELHSIDSYLRLVNEGNPDAEMFKHGPLTVSKKWPKGRPVNNNTIPRIWVDHVHFQPWVYQEIHNYFLISKCPNLFGGTGASRATASALHSSAQQHAGSSQATDTNLQQRVKKLENEVNDMRKWIRDLGRILAQPLQAPNENKK